jgi:hypothetical protein
MDSDALVEKGTNDGQKLITQLVHEGFDVTAAAWVKETEEGQWFLYVVSKEVDVAGLRAAYRRAQTIMRQMSDPLWIDRFELKLFSPASSVGTDLLDLLHTYVTGKSPVHSRRSKLGDVPIDELILYPSPSSP